MVGLVRIIDLVDAVLGRFLQRIRPGRLEAIGLKRNSVMLLRFQPQHLGRDVFQRSEQLAVSVGQEVRVGPLALDENVAALEADWVLCARPGGDPELQFQTAGGGSTAA